MLKKAGIVLAMTTAGMLALSPLAYADPVKVNNQSNSQSSNQGNGAFNGNNLGSGNSTQVCNTSVNTTITVIIGGGTVKRQTTRQGGGKCTSSGSATGQSTTQTARNTNR
ncbi:MAG: hypothetical protein ACR2GH_00715 [Pseudonocardia sp.]